SICATSAANCSWVPDPFSFDLNGDGSFDNLTDGFCEVKAIAFKKDCSQTCNACMSPALCSSSAAPSGCSWNMTSSGFPVCVPTGPPQEICFVPGDEDGDGLADCLDTNSTGGSCTQNPFCGFGASGAGVSGPMGGMGAFDSQLCIQWDNNQTGCLGQKGPVAASMENQSVCFFHPAPGQQFSPTNGWCDPLFNQQLSGGMGVDKPPTIVGTDVLNDVVEPYLDIGPVGVHESPGKADKFDLGMALRNVSTAAWCKKSYPGSINLSSLFLRYLDVDENISNGCALESNASSLGWDYKFRYFENATSGEIKIAFRCVNSSWAPMVAQTVIMKDMCLMQLGGPGGGPGPGPGGPPGGAVLDFANISAVNIMIINKADIGNPKKVQRFFVATGNQSRNESNPVDVAGPYYYTPGSIDVKFENCAIPNVDEDGDGLVSDNDPDCQSFMKQGYISFEVGPQCQDGVDNDGNGKTDCADQSCKYDPIGLCNSGQGMVCDSTDKKSPALKWLDVKTFPDFASIKFDSDEPANGTVQYYGNDSACNSINTTVLDFALLNAITNDNYKPWHDVQLGQGTLNLSLTANRTYYYKFVMTDLCNNKVTSACLNFTTTTTYSSFVFKPVPPSGLFIDIPELGVSNDNFTYAKQYNASQTKDITLKIKDPSNGFTIELQNASVLKASTLNISTLFINSGGEEYVGMNTSTWSKIQTDMFPSTINITIPDNGTGLFKCDEGNLSNCVNVSSIATCTFGTVNTTCVIPLSSGTGFSVYKVAGTQASSGSSSPSSSTSTTTTAGGGGGGVSNVTTVKGRTDSGVQKLAPGNGLRTNAKLLAAIEKVLARGKLASPAVDNLVALSDAVATDTSVEKEFNSVSGKTTITAKLKYSGKKKAMNFMVHETLPKTFANNASLITVSAPGATVTIANPDPEFVLTYPEVSEGQILTVTYTVAKDLKSILADTATAVFADELVEVPVEAPAEPAAETTAEEPQAAVPETQAQDQTGLLLGLVVVVALVVGFVLYQSKKKK
ncbi:MAG: hypothetical protein HY519_00130, partial [Candidatus Aenigmarchaeota archaeon]|nr:hypothetical protein [Candidatus Aenigmarchaeota archaeon]